MPGNEAYRRLLEFLMPPWDSGEIDVEFRNVGILGMQRTGKTTLAITIANDLKERYGDLVTLYGFWLHQVIPRAREDGVLKDTKHVLIILDDATAYHSKNVLEKRMRMELKYYWRIAHELRDAGLKLYTGKVALLYLYHSYMLVSKFMRNAHAVVVKSVLPRFQRYEHEDISLKWLDAAIVKQLTMMRFNSELREVLASLSKALIVWMTGVAEIMRFKPVKTPPRDFHDYTFLDVEEDKKMKDENTGGLEHVAPLVNALKRLLDELNLKTKVNRRKYLLVEVNNRWISLGPVAQLLRNGSTSSRGEGVNTYVQG